MFTFLQCIRRIHSQPQAKSIAAILKLKPLKEQLTVKGWLKRQHKSKKLTFFHLDDGSSLARLQVVAPSSLCPKGLTYHACLSVEGTLEESQGPDQDVELVASNVQVLSPGAPPDYPFTEKMTFLNEDLRLIPHFRSRVRYFASMLRVRSQIKMSMCNYFEREKFINIDTPLLTTNDCEGNGNSFAVKGYGPVKPYNERSEPGDSVFGHPVYLTVSGQLHLEAMANGLSKVYCCNPAFRAEGESRLHLHEFWMIEAEECLSDEKCEVRYQLLMNRIENLIKFTLRSVLDHCSDDVEFQWKSKNKRETLENVIRTASENLYICMPYSEAMKVLEDNKSRLQQPFNPNAHLNKESELFLSQYCGGIPVFITDWPVDTKPFYMLTDDENKTAYGVDLLVPHVGEIVGGGLREHCLNKLASKLVNTGLSESLAWYVDLRKWGYAPTGGFGIGLERFIQYLLGIENIKDTIPYPRSSGKCFA